MAWRTGGCAGRCLLPLLLLTASLLDWSLISLVNMVIFFAIRFVAPRRGMPAFFSTLAKYCQYISLELNYTLFGSIYCLKN
uniref:Uncharacterized protein n=1 Tax=Triticum urartu TaxID=4572 RepID=A0A8R7PSR6_TRIUA